MSQRSFGSEIGNTSLMTAADSSLIKSPNSLENATEQMEKPENGHAASTRLPRPLAIEIYTKIHNSTFTKEDLLDEIEDLVDEKYYPGEVLMSQGKEYTVVTSEKRGGLTLYTMEDGTKIGHRDLRRKKGLSLEEIQQAALEDVIHEDEKVWKVKDALLKECPIRETKKFAPIFSSANRKAQAATSSSTVIQLDEKSDGEEEEEEQEIGLNTPLRVRPSGGPAASASRRQMDKKKEKEAKEKEKLEKKEKEKEEKLRKKEEEKAKKQAEKDDKLKKKAEKAIRKSIGGGASGSQGLMDRFVKKTTEENGGDATSSGGQPSKWSEKRVALGLKKVDEAWKRRDQDAFNEACIWCEKNLSGNQRATFENPIYKFAIQKLVDKTKDKALIRGWKRAQQVEYRHEMAEKRRAVYAQYEPQIKAWFNEDIALDDLLVTSTTLDFPTAAKRLDCDAELLKCMEIAQYFVSMRKILLWNENISAEQLRDDLHKGLEGFRRSTYKMIANLLETALQEKEFEKVAHCNARLSEFPITEHTVSELIHAFFIGNTETSFKRDAKKQNRMAGYVMEEDSESEAEEEAENGEKSTENGQKPEENDPENGHNEPKPEENDPEDPEDSEEVIRRQRILALFQNPAHIYEWAPAEQLEVLYELKELVHDLPIIREWYLRDANTEQLTGLKAAANKIAKKIEDFQQQLADLPPGEITDSMSRHQTREMEKVIKKRQNLEKALDDLRDELEENREKSARERDDLERIYRVISIGNDRHLRKYYWFAYSTDAGIWVQDFGTTSYEKWVRDCREKGFMDIETLDVENRPEYEDLPITSSESTEVWYKLDTESDVKELLQSLAKNGKREKPLKKYLANNLDDILASIRKPVKKEDVKKATSEDVTDSESTEDEQLADETAEEEAPVVSKFQGPFGSLKQTMMDFLRDYQQSGITKIGDLQVFEGRLLDANNLDEMKRLFIELVTSIPKECLIEKYKMDVALVKKCFSHLIIPRFCRRVEEAKNPSCLHMLLAYFDARIDRQRTLPELPCQVCRRKNGTQRKLMCKQCATVFHYNCHRPAISPAVFEEEGFKERWWCAKCTKEDRRRQLEEARAKNEENQGSGDESGGSDEEEEDVDMLDEEEQMSRGRSAKRKANAAMRDVLEFEGVLRAPTQPPAPKRAKKDVVAEVQELFDSIERANPRLYKLIQSVPSQSRSYRNSTHECRSLTEIEEDLDVYTSAEQLHDHLKQFFQYARGWVETHNSRKLDDLEDLISELNFV
ncbi:unnamed protein product [Caenorhabditis nigoni]